MAERPAAIPTSFARSCWIAMTSAAPSSTTSLGSSWRRVVVNRQRRITGTGTPNYYVDEHTDFADFNFPIVSSMIYEGVFERFPRLKVGLIELAWSWAVPITWRLDRAYDLMRGEVSHLQRRPSEYIAEHFWFSTQPMEEPDGLGWFDDVYQLFADTLADKLMYSSDYPHWDFDEPSVLPSTLPVDTRRKIVGQTASSVYGIPLRAHSGLTVELAHA
jgi:predicted TIM-barrel fold metal-dependent hydrolase